MQKKLLLLAALGLIALFQPSLNAQNLTSVVRGTVVDAETKFPLPGAFVQVGTQKVVTDGQGLFRLSGVPIGRQTVLVSLIGYE